MGSEISKNFSNNSGDQIKLLHADIQLLSSSISNSNVNSLGFSATAQKELKKEILGKITDLFNQFRTASSADKKELYPNLKAVFLKLEETTNFPIKLRILTKCFRAYVSILGKIGGFTDPIEQIKEHPAYADSLDTDGARKLLADRQEGWILGFSTSQEKYYLSTKKGDLYYQCSINSLEDVTKTLNDLEIDIESAINVKQVRLEAIKTSPAHAGKIDETKAKNLLEGIRIGWLLHYKEIEKHPAYADSLDTDGAKKLLGDRQEGWILRFSTNQEKYYLSTKKGDSYYQCPITSLEDVTEKLNDLEIDIKSAINIKQVRLEAIKTSPAYAGKIDETKAKNLLEGIRNGWLLHFDETKGTMLLSYTKDGIFDEEPVRFLEDAEDYITTMKLTQNNEVLGRVSERRTEEIEKHKTIKEHPAYAGEFTREKAIRFLSGKENVWMLRHNASTDAFFLCYKIGHNYVEKPVNSLDEALRKLKGEGYNDEFPNENPVNVELTALNQEDYKELNLKENSINVKQDVEPFLNTQQSNESALQDAHQPTKSDQVQPIEEIKEATGTDPIKEIKEHPAYADSLDTNGARKLLADRQEGWILRFSTSQEKYYLSTKKGGVYYQCSITSLEDVTKKLNDLEIDIKSAINVEKEAMKNDSHYIEDITNDELMTLLCGTEKKVSPQTGMLSHSPGPDGWLLCPSKTDKNAMTLHYIQDGQYGCEEISSLKDANNSVTLMNIQSNTTLLNNISIINKFNKHPAYAGILNAQETEDLLKDKKPGWVLCFSTNQNQMVLVIKTASDTSLQHILINSPEHIHQALQKNDLTQLEAINLKIAV